MDKQNIYSQRVAAFRQCMEKANMDFFIVFLNDPHGSEYIARHFGCIEWLSGFTGSAATLFIGKKSAFLLTDSRYWLQAEEQLADTPFITCRETAETGIKSLLDSAVPCPERCQRVAYLNQTTSATFIEDLRKTHGERFDIRGTDEDFFQELWKERPPLPLNKLVVHPTEWAGKTPDAKLQDVKKALDEKRKQGALFVSDLSEIAWLLNLRGSDIDFNPVFYAYFAWLPAGEGRLFVDERKVTPQVREHLQQYHIQVAGYDDWKTYVKKHASEEWLLFGDTNCSVRETFDLLGCRYTDGNQEIAAVRAVKNPTEQAGFRQAMERDGVAMVSFLRELEECTDFSLLSELAVADRLEAQRSKQENFRGLSFETIAAYGPHGAIVHYEPTAETNVSLQNKSFLLLDSGAQYAEGTTDITRTIPLGPLTEEEKRVYTCVLIGHLELQDLRFPEGTTGLELDLAARRPLWKAGYDYGHGTGHGVGSYLCVHEGPQQIRKDLRNATSIGFRAGMTITDEPGVYIGGRFGVRIENTLLVVEDGKNEFGSFCRFEPLTLCPIDTRPIVWEMMSDENIRQLNEYHSTVRSRLLPLLSDEKDKEWLISKTEPVEKH